MTLHKWAGISFQCEVFNLFYGLIPQQGLSRHEAGRKRGGLVSDFRVLEPSVTGELGDQKEKALLADLKMKSSCLTRQHRNPRANVKAVYMIASVLLREYLSHAKNINRVYGELPEDVVGVGLYRPSCRASLLRCWVFCAWGEASLDVFTMVDYLAQARQNHQKFPQGRWRWERMEDEAEVVCYKGTDPEGTEPGGCEEPGKNPAGPAQ